MHTNQNVHRGSGVLLWRAANAWQRTMRATLRPHGLTQGQFLLLQATNAAALPDERIQRRVAAYVGLDTAAASTLVGQVQARGWLTVRAADDGRAKVLALTASGRALVAAVEADVAAATDRFFDPLRGDRDAFTGALAVLIGLRPRVTARQAADDQAFNG